MKISPEKLREKCAKRIYDKTMKAGMMNRHWNSLQPEVQEGFRKMVAEVFSVLFDVHPATIIEYFTGIEVKVEKKNGKG